MGGFTDGSRTTFISVDKNHPLRLKEMASIRVENMVSSTALAKKLDLQSIALSLENADYDPERFPGLIYRMKEPKTAILLFRSGKAVCTGAKDMDQVKEAIAKVSAKLGEKDVEVFADPVIEVQNMVASADLEREINLNAMAITMGLEKVEYEPEQFPGLVYRMASPKVVLLVFSSGKLVCTGAKTLEDVERAVAIISDDLRNAGII